MIARTAEDLEVDKRIVPEELITRDRKGPRTKGITFQSEEIIGRVALENGVVMRDQVLHPVGPTGASINGISHSLTDNNPGTGPTYPCRNAATG